MAESAEEPPGNSETLDKVARLTADLESQRPEELDRLRAILAAAAAAEPERALGPEPRRLAELEVDERLREAVLNAKADESELGKPPLHAVRRDSREDLLAARLAGPLTALGGAERIGPFIVDGRRIFFDFWGEARRLEISESGAGAPAFVLSSARRPVFSGRKSITLDVQEGTVWIRGNLLYPGLPVGAYVGVRATDGKLRLPRVTASTADRITIASPAEAVLDLVPAAEQVAPAEGGCASGVQLDLPLLTLTFGPGGLKIKGGKGRATVWGQSFDFLKTTGSVAFVPQLWTLLLGYEVGPDPFDAAQIESNFADFAGEAAVGAGALALPVVVAAPAALGPASVSPGFWLSLSGVEARWYAPEERFHRLDPWLILTSRSAGLVDLDVAPLAGHVQTAYRLWELDGSQSKRLPWRHVYRSPFLFSYLCDVERGESLLATGEASVALDRPVQANGRPLSMPASNGAVLLRTADGGVRATLVAARDRFSGSRVLVLRNALVWASEPVAVLADGTLSDRQRIDRGALVVQLGVHAWAPTLPDPYVGNFHVCRTSSERPRALLSATVRWASPDSPETGFSGAIGLPMVCPNFPSRGDPRPAPRSERDPDVGLTQVEQGRVHFDKAQLAAVARARAQILEFHQGRVAAAQRENENSLAAIDGELAERLGRTPPFFLLDVSTNQDLLGVALWATTAREQDAAPAAPPSGIAAGLFTVRELDVNSPVEALRLMTLPQIQWEPVRTLDEDQDILTLGWFPTPLASATDGGPTVLGARSQRLVPVVPEALLITTKAVFDEGADVTFRTTLPFGLIAAVSLNPNDSGSRKADSYEINRPDFPAEAATGGLHITTMAEGGRDAEGEISPFFEGATRQLINGVDLASGAPLGLSVLSSTGDPGGDVETIFNNDMAANPKVPVTRFDLSGYGGSNFSKWENPFALFAETAKTQFQVTMGRTALEIIKVASVLHPWGIKVTRSVIVERRSGGGVIRRDTGWQATSPGLFDYRFIKGAPPNPKVADYAFDAGIFEGLFNVRRIRPAPGLAFSSGGATFLPYYFDSELQLEGLAGRTPANGVLGWLQTEPNGAPASAAALRALIEAEGAVGGPVDAWIEFGASRLPFRARRIEVDVTSQGGGPLFVAAVRGVPKLPKTGAWSVVRRPVAAVPPDGGEAVPISETKGVPIVRRYAVKYVAGDLSHFDRPPRDPSVPIGDWRMADPNDLLAPAAPQNEYCLLQSAPTHGFLFPRPYARNSGPARVRSDRPPELADIIARATSKGAFPPAQNAIRLGAPLHFDVGPGGSMALPGIVTVVDHPTPLRLAGTPGHGSELSYSGSTLELELTHTKWRAEFVGLTMWSDIAGLDRASGARLRIVGSTDQRPQVAQIDTLVYPPVEEILTYLPIFGAREPLGPIDLGASNAKHEIKIEMSVVAEVPKDGFSIAGGKIKLLLGASGSTGFDLASGGVKASGELMAGAKGEFPLLSVGAASVYLIVQLDVKFSIVSVTGVVTSEKLELVAFVGVGIKGQVGPFEAYAYLGIGFVFIYDFTSGTPKFGGLVRFEAKIDLHVVKVKLFAELKGVVYKKLMPPATTEKTYCDYSGKVKLQVDLFLIISISATYTVSDTKALE